MIARRLALAPAAALACMAGAAGAQDYQCKAPALATWPTAKIERDGPVRRLPVTGYTLAASWSPEFCKGRERQLRHLTQCSGRNGRFGMILHGLWPESRGGRWPQWCPTTRTPRASDMRGAFCTTPSPRLQARQWFKHGACMTRLPKTYFNVGSILWRSIRWPDLDRLSRRRDLKAGDIRTAITDANAALKPDMVAIKLDGGGWLEEVRICYGKDFMPRACHPSRRGARDGVKAKIWRGL